MEGFENLEFAEKDCRDFIDKTKHLTLGKGGDEPISNYFERMREINDGFVIVIYVDDKFRIINVFWIYA